MTISGYGRTLIDVQKGQLILRVQEKQVTFNIFKAMRYPDDDGCCMRVHIVDACTKEVFEVHYPAEPLKACLVGITNAKNSEITECVQYLEARPLAFIKRPFEEFGKGITKSMSSIEKPPILKLKLLPAHLRYAFLGDSSTLPVIVSASLIEEQLDKLLRVLRDHKTALGWSIADIKGTNPSIYMHKILIEDSYRPSVEHQRCLNPNIKEVVRPKVLKFLDAGIVYPISDSPWVSLVQVVPKKGGMTAVHNENNELILTRTVTG